MGPWSCRVSGCQDGKTSFNTFLAGSLIKFELGWKLECVEENIWLIDEMKVNEGQHVTNIHVIAARIFCLKPPQLEGTIYQPSDTYRDEEVWKV